MAEFDDGAHPRDEGGKFTDGGGNAHVSGAARSGDHQKAQAAHQKAAQNAKDPMERASHQAAAANHAGQSARAEHEANGLASFVEKHAPAEGHGGHEESHAHDDGHHAAGHGDGPHGAKHEEGHGLGAWVAHHLDEAKEGLHEKGEEARELAEKVIEGDPFKAAEAVAGAAGHAAAEPLKGVGEKIEHANHAGGPHGGAHH